MTDIRAHWQGVYETRAEPQTSWFRPHLDESLALIQGLGLDPSTPAIDVGAGRSTLVDDLLAAGWTDLTVLDLSEAALTDARVRLGELGEPVRWLVADITESLLPPAHFGLWHDRAVFHFLVDDQTRARYVATATDAIRDGGYLVLATFAPDGPEKCSGLPVRRYDADELAALFAGGFEPVVASRELHTTPQGTSQAFTYVVLRRRAQDQASP